MQTLVRVQSQIHSRRNTVKRQSTNTLRCMQPLVRVQSQIHSRRIRMSEDNHALQRQLQLKCERELEGSKFGEEWDASLQSKEQIEANVLNKQEAAIRRERALAYAYSHQWKSSSRSVTPTCTNLNSPHWSWSCLERWMAARPWENRNMSDKDLKSACCNITGDTNNAYARRDSILERTSPTPQKPSCSVSRLSPSISPSKASSVTGKLKSASPKSGGGHLEDDSRSMQSLHSDRPPRRHGIPGSSIRDNESLTSSPTIPSYMASTESVRARSRFQSSSTLNDNVETSDKGSLSLAKKRLSSDKGVQSPSTLNDNVETSDKGSLSLAKKRLSSDKGVMRRHSGPPKVNTALLKDVVVGSEQASSSGLAMD